MFEHTSATASGSRSRRLRTLVAAALVVLLMCLVVLLFAILRLERRQSTLIRWTEVNATSASMEATGDWTAARISPPCHDANPEALLTLEARSADTAIASRLETQLRVDAWEITVGVGQASDSGALLAATGPDGSTFIVVEEIAGKLAAELSADDRR